MQPDPFVNNEKHKIEWIKSVSEIASETSEAMYGAIDKDNNVYVSTTEYEDDFLTYSKETLHKFSKDGKNLANCCIKTAESDPEYWWADQIYCGDGYVQIYDGDSYSSKRIDFETGEITEFVHYNEEALEDAMWHFFIDDTRLLISYNDGTFGIAGPNDEYEDLGHVVYYFDDSKPGLIIDFAFTLGDKILLTDARYIDSYYEYKNGEVEKVSDARHLLNMEDASDEEYYELISDFPIFAMVQNDALTIVAGQDSLFYTEDTINHVHVGEIGDFSLTPTLVISGVVKTILFYLMYICGAIAVILLVGSIMKWRLSLRSKMFIIIMPLTILAIVIITHYELSAVESDFKDQLFNEYEAIGSLYLKQLDVKELMAAKSTEDAYIMENFRDELIELLDSDTGWSDSVTISIYKLFDNDFHMLMYNNLPSDPICGSYFYTNWEKNEKYRVPGTDVYHYESRGQVYTYIDTMQMIRDEKGTPVAFIDVFGNMEKLQISQDKIKRKVIVITIILGIIMGALIYLLSLYIINYLRKTSKTVQKISEGDFSARIEKISNDELGVISEGVNDMAGHIENLFAEQEDFSIQVIETLVGTIDAKDKYTNGHSIRVAKYSKMIAEKLGKTADECKQVYYIGLLHDIGKIGVPDSIINKTSRLDDEEYAIIKTHTVVGNNLLSKLTKIENVSIGAHYHHERYDGKGYPEGIKGEDIPEIARIIAVADTYDAMTSNRSYRKGLDQDKVRSELEKCKGTQFDPKFADIMLEIDEEIADSVYGEA